MGRALLREACAHSLPSSPRSSLEPSDEAVPTTMVLNMIAQFRPYATNATRGSRIFRSFSKKITDFRLMIAEYQRFRENIYHSRNVNAISSKLLKKAYKIQHLLKMKRQQ